ncbi:E3 ubiquitin/ISG15 ligase TRIM25-like [Scomber scombrus]|uniref:E3 ubiquitin/ISG15 ligase TRIM25-like n=1 Tax=Scomber scombrus TaxID=13677 RepID=UPI002DD7F89B|nr:E3 ubiquitin/ISG15 ligase TRIM25-like [Scomber scombrus]XP_062293859.1 E3 ubiquitin/ISG15 ligase TRIM25-like [Scomber scombrus]
MDESQFSLMSLEDELTCSICLSTFDSPVTIPCGHNFCQDCLIASWEDTYYSCPQCRTHFDIKPELKKNTVLSTVVETFRASSSQSEVGLSEEEEEEEEDEDEEEGEDSPEEDEVLRCDTCMEAEASKTCLTCMASFCEEHLRPHLENPKLSLHQLSEPLHDLMERICKDHHKMMEFYCTQHDRLICSVCLQVHKDCNYISPEEQRNLKESDLRNKLSLLDGKIEKTDKTIFQINNMQGKLKEAATNRKTALAAVYQAMRDMLTQEEREAQHAVDRELEIGLTKHRDFLKKFTENTEIMRKAKDDINSLLSQSETLPFLQDTFDLPRVVNCEPHIPRINLDTKKVIATQTFASGLKGHLSKLFKQPVEDRLPLVKTGEQAASVSEGASNEPERESETPEPPPQRNPPRSHSPGRPPIQPYFHPAPGFPFMGSHPGWNPPQHSMAGPHSGFFMAPPRFMGGHRPRPDKKPHNAPGGNKPGTTGGGKPSNPGGGKPSNPGGGKPSHPGGKKPHDNPKSHSPSDKSTKQHQRPHKKN